MDRFIVLGRGGIPEAGLEGQAEEAVEVQVMRVKRDQESENMIGDKLDTVG